MNICRVIGTVVSTTKDEKLTGKKLLVVQPVDMITRAPDGKALVAIDTVHAGKGEIVMTVSGSSARQTKATQGVPVDATIIAIVDTIEIDGKVTYDKMKEGE
ncbi:MULTISPECIES: EutN/CcmL family microcompartment protein [unclassified Paenibacillus]|uniref:EutN/CcmL family microcompartment protein n=1 Tax=unclassified Paenibacillus TaxID=185978 RepID=UPI001C1135BE|nr:MULTISPECIES: EutN/CcmL family microcompartment protein [unclassified Paenibacillus]MBU5441255.1 EutN/CcmL family microcompartment protein [Paenibacillus sp. MSJ-34]CAH0122302.1 Ethanolamine utilization protein EutN [Paenibacillus sp. CECT 9249]